MTSPKRLLIEERLGRDLAGYVNELRHDGASWTFIAARIERHTNVTVTDQTIRNWFGDAVSAA
jgi:intein-encoded DNA endonuclease-like protein